MNDLLYDIIVLENALVALREGAYPEKRSAENSLEKLIASKMKAVKDYEDELYEKEFKELIDPAVAAMEAKKSVLDGSVEMVE